MAPSQMRPGLAPIAEPSSAASVVSGNLEDVEVL